MYYGLMSEHIFNKNNRHYTFLFDSCHLCDYSEHKTETFGSNIEETDYTT